MANIGLENVGLKVLHIVLMIWGRRWYALFTALAVCVIGWTAVFSIPSRYEANTRIYVDTETLLAPLLRGMTVDVNIAQQIDMMQRTLMSRPNIENVLRMTDMDLWANTSQEKDDLIKSVEGRIAIRSYVRNLFTVSFVDPDPEVAKKVVQALLTIFIESNLGASRTDIQKARRFIDDQIAEYEAQLKAMEARMADFKREHPGMMSQSGTVAARLEMHRDRISQSDAEIEDATARREAIAKEMRSTPQYLQVDGVPLMMGGVVDPAALLDKDIADARQRLSQLRFKFTDQHPDVLEAQRLLDDLTKQRAAMGSGSAARAPGTVSQRVANPLYDQVRLRLLDADTQLQTLQRRKASLLTELTRLEGLAQTSPDVEAQALALDRDYGVIRRNYEDLLARRETAKLSQDVDTKAEKVQFRVIDPPYVPREPNYPNRPLLLTAVLLAGLGAGVVVAFTYAKIQDAFSSAQQVMDAFRLNVIGSVSWVSTASPRHQMKETVVFSSAMVGLILMYGILLIAVAVPSTVTALSLNPQNIRFDELSSGIGRVFDFLRSAF